MNHIIKSISFNPIKYYNQEIHKYYNDKSSNKQKPKKEDCIYFDYMNSFGREIGTMYCEPEHKFEIPNYHSGKGDLVYTIGNNIRTLVEFKDAFSRTYDIKGQLTQIICYYGLGKLQNDNFTHLSLVSQVQLIDIPVDKNKELLDEYSNQYLNKIKIQENLRYAPNSLGEHELTPLNDFIYYSYEIGDEGLDPRRVITNLINSCD